MFLRLIGVRSIHYADRVAPVARQEIRRQAIREVEEQRMGPHVTQPLAGAPAAAAAAAPAAATTAGLAAGAGARAVPAVPISTSTEQTSPPQVVGPSPAGLSAGSPPSASTSVANRTQTGFGGGGIVSRFFGAGTTDDVAAPSPAPGVSSSDPSSDYAPEGGAESRAGVAGAGSGVAPAVGASAAVLAGVSTGVAVAAATRGGPRAGDPAGDRGSGGPIPEGTIPGALERQQAQGEGAGAGDAVGGGAVGASTAIDAATAAGRMAALAEAKMQRRSLSPEEVRAYSENVDRTLQAGFLARVDFFRPWDGAGRRISCCASCSADSVERRWAGDRRAGALDEGPVRGLDCVMMLVI